MSSRKSLAVSNVGPLIHLAKAGLLGLLRPMYGKDAIPHEVKVEVVDRGKSRRFADALQVEEALKGGLDKGRGDEDP